MKIKKITVENFKAISRQTADFDGCSAIIAGGNNRGKTSLLTGLINRLQSEKPDIVVRRGEEKGFHMMELTDGSVIEWNFTKKSERIHFTTADGFKQTTGVIGQVGERYFGQKFDIDKFLTKSAAEQGKELQRLLGLDLDEIEARYKIEYDKRTEANKELKRLTALRKTKPEKVEKPDIRAIQKQVKEAREKNEKVEKEIRRRDHLKAELGRIVNIVKDSNFSEYFDQEEAQKMIDSIEVGKLIEISGMEAKLDHANEQLRKYDIYEINLEGYNNWVKEGKAARAKAKDLDDKVKAIQKERTDKIAAAKMPEGFALEDGGLTYNGFPLTTNQISQSAKYIAALKLASMVCGEVKVMHFDASALDYASLSEVQSYAEENDLQLLIERPDVYGQEIEYRIFHSQEEMIDADVALKEEAAERYRKGQKGRGKSEEE